MEKFQYAGMPKVYFGEGALDAAMSAELSDMGTHVMLAYGGGSIKRNGIYDKVRGLLEESGKEIFEFSGIMANPTYAKVQEGAELARENQIDFILAVGGGSVIDCCKIVSAQARMDKDIWKAEFEDHQYPTEFIPLGAVTTVSGTGSEMNNGAVITNEETKQKNGMGGALSRFAVLDPSYTLTVPMRQAVSGAFDTLSHCMETYFGRPSETNVSDEINESVMRNVIKNIRAMIRNPQDVSVRSELMWDSSMAENGILKLGKQTDFQNHMIEHQLGAYTDCNHGQGLAVIHPAVYRHLVKDNTSKFDRFAKKVWHLSAGGRTDEELALAGIQALSDFIHEIGLPTTLTELKAGMRQGSPDPTDRELLRKVADSTVITAGCARQMTHDEIYEILTECI
ncbi:MAG: iron-containing alcohol dehydrogenase [Oscillospiraceae bacterium]|jgi:alcohol dehydrogenase YqhD (iron-dependent ADH family)